MTSFENTLWDRLAQRGAETVAVAPERRKASRPYLVSAGAGAVVAAAAVAGVLAIEGSTGAPPAYALTQQHNGDYTLSMHALSRHTVAEVNSTLGHRGINATVVPAGTRRCPSVTPAIRATRPAPARTSPASPARSRALARPVPASGSRAARPAVARLSTHPVTFSAAQVRSGRHAYVLARRIRSGRVVLSRAIPTVPACVRTASVPGSAATSAGR